MAKTDLEPPDEVLVVAAIVGDLEAFDELAARYRAAVVRAAQAIVGREDAEDVAQDALLLAFKALPSLEDPRKFAAWLQAITRHRALRLSKRERARKHASRELDDRNACLLEGRRDFLLDEPSVIDDGHVAPRIALRFQLREETAEVDSLVAQRRKP